MTKSKKLGAVVVLFSMLLGGAAVSCGDPCAELEQELLDCCAKIKDNAASKSLCEQEAKNVAGTDTAQCESSLGNYTCEH